MKLEKKFHGGTKMVSVDEYVNMAEDAAEERAHVAVLTYYNFALEETRYSSNAAHVLLAATQYAQRLKKDRDREAVAKWGKIALDRMKPNTDLAGAINQEITKLQIGGKENVTP